MFEVGSKVVIVASKSVKLQVWDTAGQERFKSITRNYYRGVAFALLVYDISSRNSYNALTSWLREIQESVRPNVDIMLLGNKKDLEADRKVTFDEASGFARENGLSYLETSAKTGENVEKVFLQCTRSILSKIDAGVLGPEFENAGIHYGNEHINLPKTTPTTARPRRWKC